MNALWERPDFRSAAGDAWRPGGVELTGRALDACASLGLLAQGGTVLDLGSGAGATLRLLAQRGYRAVGLDKHAECVSPAGVPLPCDACSLVRADLARPPLAAGCCDGVLCECVLSLLDNPQAVLGAVFRALRPGGALVVSDLMLRPGHDLAPAACSCGPDGAEAVCGSAPAGAQSRVAVGSDGSVEDALKNSCLAGARPESAWRGLITSAGFALQRYEDNSRALVELAARMLWYGEGDSRPSGSCACRGVGAGRPWRAYGYGLWIARKEAL